MAYAMHVPHRAGRRGRGLPFDYTQAHAVNPGASTLVILTGGTRRRTNDNGENEMMKKLMLAIATLVASMNLAFAQVDVNKADAAALDSVKGVGPAMSKAIIDERTKGGAFKDWSDFQKRVKGVGDKRGAKLSQAGLQVNGQAKDGAPMAAPAEKGAKAAKAGAAG
jgi:competence protein ComEA